MKLCYLQTALYIVFLTSLVVHHRAGISGKIFALLIILSLFGCAVSLTLADYLKNMIQPVYMTKNHWKRSCNSFKMQTILLMLES